ncbi:N-acetylglucosamine-6-phosphate deacetylase [candidate division KSB1 bacterium]|nr:MAG: N-acetylglucosamine-6-phosphate deacetylase [candidate division KSB1 bacterium]
MKYALINAEIITPFRIITNGTILIEKSRIIELGRKSDVSIQKRVKVIDLGGLICSPGFIDLHIHGANGFDFAGATSEELEEIFNYLIEHGITGVLATIDPRPFEKFTKYIKYIAEYCLKKDRNPVLKGLHLEGPFLNREMCGAMNPDYMLEPDPEVWRIMKNAGKGFIRLMTIAPEVNNGMKIIRKAVKDNIVLSIGHSAASFDEIETAIDNGITQVTHIFNAMNPIRHRKPDVLVGALLMPELKTQLIADGIHVHPAVIKLLYKLKGANGIILISDAMKATGKGDGEYNINGKRVFVKGNRAFLDNGTLAGSTHTLDIGLKTMVQKADVPLTDAVRMATLNPARVLKEDNKKGILAAGKDADISIFDNNFDVQMTIIKGKIVYRK